MKKYLLTISVILLKAAISFGITHTVINSGFTFSPATLIINQGDTVVFNLESIHTVVEVDKTTWDADKNIQLTGGFFLPEGGGKLTGLTVGTHYYVCGPHATFGMKGKIIVNPPQGINNLSVIQSNNLLVCPNPVVSEFYISYSVKQRSSVDISLIDITGKLVTKFVSEEQLPGKYKLDIDNNYIPGIYFVRFSDNKNTRLSKLLIF